MTIQNRKVFSLTCLRIQILVNDEALPELDQEHGFALALEIHGKKILFDTGAGKTLAPNSVRCGYHAKDFDLLVISHGHYDHTGGLAWFLGENDHAVIYGGEGIHRDRFSLVPDQPARNIAMPKSCRDAWLALPAHRRVGWNTTGPVTTSLFLTGPIPRRSGEDCGGSFWLDRACTIPDLITDERSLIVRFSGNDLLITGCCHAGIVNTLDYCRKAGFNVNAVLGGLHLKQAVPDRLESIRIALERHGVRSLYLSHCTGETAMTWLARHFHGETRRVRAGDVLNFNSNGDCVSKDKC